MPHHLVFASLCWIWSSFRHPHTSTASTPDFPHRQAKGPKGGKRVKKKRDGVQGVKIGHRACSSAQRRSRSRSCRSRRSRQSAVGQLPGCGRPSQARGLGLLNCFRRCRLPPAGAEARGWVFGAEVRGNPREQRQSLIPAIACALGRVVDCAVFGIRE